MGGTHSDARQTVAKQGPSWSAALFKQLHAAENCTAAAARVAQRWGWDGAGGAPAACAWAASRASTLRRVLSTALGVSAATSWLQLHALLSPDQRDMIDDHKWYKLVMSLARQSAAGNRTNTLQGGGLGSLKALLFLVLAFAALSSVLFSHRITNREWATLQQEPSTAAEQSRLSYTLLALQYMPEIAPQLTLNGARPQDEWTRRMMEDRAFRMTFESWLTEVKIIAQTLHLRDDPILLSGVDAEWQKGVYDLFSAKYAAERRLAERALKSAADEQAAGGGSAGGSRADEPTRRAFTFGILSLVGLNIVNIFGWREMGRQEGVRQEAARQEAARQEAARQEGVRQEAARQEAARQEAERQEAERQEAERQDRHEEAERAREWRVRQIELFRPVHQGLHQHHLRGIQGRLRPAAAQPPPQYYIKVGPAEQVTVCNISLDPEEEIDIASRVYVNARGCRVVFKRENLLTWLETHNMVPVAGRIEISQELKMRLVEYLRDELNTEFFLFT
jgi:hypothetical protein